MLVWGFGECVGDDHEGVLFEGSILDTKSGDGLNNVAGLPP